MVNFIYSIEHFLNDRIIGPPWQWFIKHSRFWLPAMIIGMVLLISAGLGYRGSPRIQQLVIVLIPGLGAALAILRWPTLGLIALIGTIAIPINGPSNSNLTLAVAAMLIGLWILDMLVLKRQIQLISSLPIKPLLALVVVAMLAFGAGQLPWYTFAERAPLGAQLAGLSLFVISAGLFLVVAHQVHDIVWLQWLVFLFISLGTIAVLGRVLPGMGPINRLFSSQATGSLFWTWLFTLTLSQALLNRHLQPIWRAALGGVTVVTFYVMITQLWAWNSGWMPAVAAAIVIVLAAFPRLGLVGILAGVLGALVKVQEVVSAIMVGDNEYSLATRLEAWVIVWDIAKINPVLGLGPANYYYYTPLFPIRGWAVRFNSHQQYVDLIAQTGILGLLCFVAFFAAVGWVGWRIRHRVPEGFAKAYVYGAIGGVAGTFTAAAFGDWVIPFFYNITLGGFRASMLSWLFLGGLIAIEGIYAPKGADSHT